MIFLLRPLSAARCVAMLLFAAFVVAGEAQAQTTMRVVGSTSGLNEGQTTTFTVRAASPTVGLVPGTYMIPFTITGANGGDAADYEFVADASLVSYESTGVISFATLGRIQIRLTDDSVPEPQESLTLQISTPTGGTVYPLHPTNNAATITINPSDPIHIGFAENSRAVAVREGAGAVTLTVVISSPGTATAIERDAFSLVVSTMDGTATGGDDYVMITEQMIGPFGDATRSQSVTITIQDDMAPERERASTFSVALSFPPGDEPPPNVVIEDGTTTIDIVDDDLIRIGFEEDSLEVPEGAGAVTLTVVISDVPVSGGLMGRAAFSLVANTMAGTADGNDYTELTNHSVGPFSDATRSLDVAIAIPDDMVPEGASTFSVALSFPPGEGTPADILIVTGTTTISIVDDDPVTLGFAEDSRAVMWRESSGTVTLTVEITEPAADEPLEHVFSIVANPVEGTADGGDDYPVTSYPVGPFSGATRSVSVEIAIENDRVPEEAETFSVVLSLPSGAADAGNIVIAPTTATITIEDEDRVTVGFERTSYVESEDVGQFQVCVMVTNPPLSQPLDRTFPVSVNTRESEATNADYNPITNQVVGPFSDARRRECFAVGITNDTLIENTERFRLELSQPSGQALSRVDVNPDMATVTINDDEELLIGWSDPALAVFEGDVMVVGTVSILSTAMLTRDNIFVIANTVDGTAFGSTDYVARTNQRIGPFSSDTRSLPVEIGLIDRETDDGSRTFSVTLAAAAGSLPLTRNPDTLTITIRDDPVRVSLVEPEPGALFIAADDATTPQAGLNISTPRGAATTVLWSITTGPASMNSAAPEDFVGHSSYPITGAVVVLSTTTETHLFDLPGLVEYTDRDTEDRFFTLTLTGASGGGLAAGIITATPSVVTLGIAGRDTAPPRFSGLSWAGGQSRVWLRANEDLAILPPSRRTEVMTPEQLAASAEVRGFALTVTGSNVGAVMVTSALYHAPRGIALELARELTVDDGGVFAVYEYPGGDVPGIFDRALDVRTNETRNQTTQTATITISYGVMADADSDGIPDAAEARIGSNPLVAALPGERPAFAIASGRRGSAGTPALIAYSGIREYGARAHLGVSSVLSTTQTAANTTVTQAAATNIQAYYLSDTFGYDGGYADISSYGCTGEFPANYAAMVRAGGCETVDWSNVIANVEHRIGWLATTGENGLWAVDTATASNLPEQFIQRVPELNMDSQRLFTTGNDVVVRAAFDSTRIAATTLTLELSRIPVGSTVATAETEDSAGTPPTFSITSSFAIPATTGTEVWQITGLRNAGGTFRLWRATTRSSPRMDEYSLGLSTQTVVEVVPGADGFPPVVGRPQLTCNGNVVNVLVTGVACTLELPVRVGSTPETRVFTLTAPDDVPESIEVAGSGDTTATVMLRYPVVAATDPLATAGGDADNDGIADAHDPYDDIAYLPVAVSLEVSGTAGARIWQHIRPVFSGQGLRIGDSSLARAVTAGATRGTVVYNDYAASRFDNLPSGLSAVYDFSVFGVDYAGAGDEGGLAGVIIPLPQARYDDSGANLVVKYREGAAPVNFEATPGGNDYGFAPLVDGACPDDTGAVGSRYRDDDGVLRRVKSAGDACLVVYVVDGGDYDADGAINSVVKDPLGLRAGAVGGGGRRHHSGGFGLPALAALLLLLLLASGRRGAATRPS